METFTCSRCGAVKEKQTSGGTGYATDDSGAVICYACCADIDREFMAREGRITLYLQCEPRSKSLNNGRPFTPSTLNHGAGRNTQGKVTNWPGTLSFQCHTRTGRHNIAGTRYDCWFTGPDGAEWHGVTYGENTQICHCRRLKARK